MLQRVHTLLLRCGNLLILHGAGSVGNIRGSVQEGLDTVAAPTSGEGDHHVGMGLHKLFYHPLGDGEHRGGALDYHISSESGASKKSHSHTRCSKTDTELFHKSSTSSGDVAEQSPAFTEELREGT